MEPKKSKTNLAQSQRDYKTDNLEMGEEPPQMLEIESQGTGPAQSAEDVTTTTTGSFSSNELWWSILPYSRARRLWLVLRSGLYRLVEKMKRAELRVMHLTHGLESLRRLEIPAGLLAVALDAESTRLVLLDKSGQLHLHAEDGWARGHAQVPIELTGLVALVGFQHMGQRPGRFIGWGPEGIVVLSKDLELMSRNFLEPSQLPTCCGLMPGKAMVVIGEQGGGLSLWEFRGGGRRLVLAATLPTLSKRGRSFSRLAVDVAPRGVFPRCFAVCGTDLLTYDLANRKIVDVRRKLHKTLISDLLYCEILDVVVTASRDSTVKVWDPDWQIRSVFVGHRGPVTALALLPNSMLVLSASQDMTLRTWNLETAQQMGEVSLRSPWDGIPGKEEIISYPSPSNCFETVCRLWPPVRPGAPLLAQGATYLELWIVRQLHQPLATLNAGVQGLELAPPLPQADRHLLPQRVVSRCADGTVRVFSAVSGQMISTLLLEPGELAAATAYCLPREVLLVLSAEGALLRANATRCPMLVVRRLPPPPPPRAAPQPCCLHLVSHVVDQPRAYNCWEGVHSRGGELRRKSWHGTKWEDNNRFLPVLGYTDGSIAVLDWGSLRTLSHIKAHSPGSTTNIASCQQNLVTAGTDKTVKMWQVFPYAEDSLTLLRTFFCYQSTVAVCPLGCRVTVAFEDPCSATYTLVQYGTAECEEDRHDHGPQEDPTDHITGLCCCPYLKLYASSSLDCTLRIWTEDNKLLRIMHLNMPPQAITFCNDMGDLILALGSQLCLLSHKLYLPTIYLVKVLCRKLPHPKEDQPLSMSDLELLTPEELKRLNGWQALPRVRMKHSVKQEYIDAEKKELEIKEACAKLALRDQELQDLALGQVEPLAQILITPQLRLEAFHNYLQVIYGSRLDSVSKEEDEALQEEALGSTDRRPLTSIVSQSSLCQKWGMSLDVMFMQGATSTKSSTVEKILKMSQIPLSQRTLQPCSDFSGFFPSSRTLPGLPSTISKYISPLVQFPGYIPNSVAIQQLWQKSDLKGVGEVTHLKTESFEILENEMDLMWLPWGTNKKKEKVWMNKALGLVPTKENEQISVPVSHEQEEHFETALPKRIFHIDWLEETSMHQGFMVLNLRLLLLEFLSNQAQAAPKTWDPASTYAPSEVSHEVPKIVIALLKEDWFQKYFPDFNFKTYPEFFTVEGIATMLMKVLEQANWEDGTQVMLLLMEMVPWLGIEFRKKLHRLLLKLLNKDPPPNLVDKVEKKFVMTALQMLLVGVLGSRDLVLELMSYFLYSPPRCRPALKRLLEDLGLKDPHNFLFKEMVTWAEGKDLTSKAALRGRCGQKLELMIKNLRNYLKKNFLGVTWQERIPIRTQKPPSQESLSALLSTIVPEAPSGKRKSIYAMRASKPSLKVSPRPSEAELSSKISFEHPPKHSPKHSTEVSPKHSPRLSPEPDRKPSLEVSPKISPKAPSRLTPMPSQKVSPKFSPKFPYRLFPKPPSQVSSKPSPQPSPEPSPEPFSEPSLEPSPKPLPQVSELSPKSSLEASLKSLLQPSLKPSLKFSSRPSTRLLGFRAGLSPFLSPHFLGSPSEAFPGSVFASSGIPTPPDSRAISPASFRFISISQPPILQRAVSELQWPQTFEGKLVARHSAPASLMPGWLPFAEYKYPFLDTAISRAPLPEEEFEIEITPIHPFSFFREQRLLAQKERLKMRAAMRHVKPNTIVMQPRDVLLPGYGTTRGRKILRLQERGDPQALLTPLVEAKNYQKIRRRTGTISRSLKLPLPRVEPIPFPPTWPPASRPLPPLILEDSLQRYFLPKLTRPENYR
ncbi:WD repeat-containing protein 97 isoform X2 [Sarcophilus harrisii]|uniref:WD repeat-containing protein 97 isoform X2 n=1 Tax=Sarcophilus harrisii TaxID=9305 RepID=UPI001301DAFE|nr:WD repeat-containing protein 97 isoform X2 [Sarcophilus harrisii]